MVTGYWEVLGETSIDALGVMAQGRSLAMEDLAGIADIAAIYVEDALSVELSVTRTQWRRRNKHTGPCKPP